MRQQKRYIMMVLMVAAVLSFAIMPSTANAYDDIADAQIIMIGTYLSGGATKIVVTVKDASATPKFTGNRQYFLHPDLGNQYQQCVKSAILGNCRAYANRLCSIVDYFICLGI